MKKTIRRARRNEPLRARFLIFIFFAVCVLFSAACAWRFFRKSPTHEDFIHSGAADEADGGTFPRPETGGDLTGRSTDKAESGAAEDPIHDHVQDDDADEAWMLLLVNYMHPLPDDFSVSLADLPGGHRTDARVVDDLMNMLDDMRGEGISPVICSSYRTNEKQSALYEKEVQGYLGKGMSRADAELAAAMWVAVPGTSEHQTGLAFDIVDESYQLLDEGQEKTPVQRWLMKNSYKYGFILRYPNDKSDITGISYEPWHYRYVGVDAATKIYESGLCLEEYTAAHERGEV